VMVALRERSLKAMHAGTMLAMAAGAEVHDLFLKAELEDGTEDVESVLDAVSKGDPWEACKALPIGADPRNWIRESMLVPEEATEATEWVNQLFEGKGFGAFFDFQTTVRGSRRFGQIASPMSFTINFCSDKEISNAVDNGSLPESLPAQDGYIVAEQQVSDKQHQKRRSEITEKLLIKVNQEQLDQGTQLYKNKLQKSLEVQMLEHAAGPKGTGPLTIRHYFDDHKVLDAEGRDWICVKEERLCLTRNGDFYHLVTALYSFRPACPRAEAVAAKYRAMMEAAQTRTVQPDTPLATPTIAALNGPPTVSREEDAELATAKKGELSEMFNDEDLFDFDGLEWDDMPLISELPPFTISAK